ncbi:hypothetical protein niasHS_015950 [Heterodera schachtii]|uniref:Uncharacterized protein n=2 Tax=Heterodera TaxID=34509 RepID=A0ABD2HXH6_HETSC
MEENSKNETQKKNGGTKQQPKQNTQQQRPTEAMLRVSFLEQAATLLANNEEDERPSSSTGRGCGTTGGQTVVPNSAGHGTPNLLSRLLLRELRECAFVDQLRMHRDFKRSNCKRCFQNWLSIEGKTQIEVKARPGAIVRICKNCGAERRFPTTNPNYRTRNEKTGHLE